LQHRAGEAVATLNVAAADGVLAAPPMESATPALCALAVECIKVVERAELSTQLARLVSAGCEVLAELLDPRTREHRATWSFNWLDETLEELSDQLDFLALEVYCGLGRLEGAVLESEELPVVMDPDQDAFGSYWGSIEHRQALQELSTWLLCLVFRALSYGAVTARNLMEFANHDLLCLCALLRGLLAVRPGFEEGLPYDTAELQGVALHALCGLTAPELAFPHTAESSSDAADGEDDGFPGALEAEEGIESQNRILGFYLEVLCAAIVETGVLEEALNAALVTARGGVTSESVAVGSRFLSFMGALMIQADRAEPSESGEAEHPALRLRVEVERRADGLGMLLEAILAAGFSSASQLRELAVSCASLSAALAAQGSPDIEDDGFTLACRELVHQCVASGVPQGRDMAVTLAALAAIANNVSVMEASRVRLAELAGFLSAEECQRACRKLTRVDCMRLPVRGGPAEALSIFPVLPPAAPLGGVAAPAPPLPPAEAPPPASPAPAAAAASAPGLRDVVRNAPRELRCALDGKLLCDPVVSPAGVVFERSTLARWLQTHPPQCPVTGQPITLADCQRSPELRRKVTDWVRGSGRTKEPKKKAR